MIFWGFTLSSCDWRTAGDSCAARSRSSSPGSPSEPFLEFFRYLPAPAFGALAVAVLGIYDAPKIAVIFIGTFFQQVLVVANTTRKVDTSLLEAAQTLGAGRAQLLFKVIVPAIVVDLYTDMRILLGWAWTYLIVAELVGTTSGITYFINQQARYRNYQNVFAAIFIIGFIGLFSDVALARIGEHLFPWRRDREARVALDDPSPGPGIRPAQTRRLLHPAGMIHVRPARLDDRTRAPRAGPRGPRAVPAPRPAASALEGAQASASSVPHPSTARSPRRKTRIGPGAPPRARLLDSGRPAAGSRRSFESSPASTTRARDCSCSTVRRFAGPVETAGWRLKATRSSRGGRCSRT